MQQCLHCKSILVKWNWDKYKLEKADKIGKKAWIWNYHWLHQCCVCNCIQVTLEPVTKGISREWLGLLMGLKKLMGIRIFN